MCIDTFQHHYGYLMSFLQMLMLEAMNFSYFHPLPYEFITTSNLCFSHFFFSYRVQLVMCIMQSQCCYDCLMPFSVDICVRSCELQLFSFTSQETHCNLKFMFFSNSFLVTGCDWSFAQQVLSVAVIS